MSENTNGTADRLDKLEQRISESEAVDMTAQIKRLEVLERANVKAAADDDLYKLEQRVDALEAQPPTPGAPGSARLYAKMAQVMGAVGRVEKRGKSKDSSGKEYTYVTDEDLYAACRDAMSAAGIALIPRITHIEDSSKPVVVFIDFVLACTDTGATVTIPWIGKSYNAPDKAISSAVTMAEKYMLKSTFLIATGDPADDPDFGPPSGLEPPQGAKSSPENAKRNEVTPETPARVASNSRPVQPRQAPVRPYTPAGNGTRAKAK